MITTRTTFILGAGASYPYGLPLGERLWRDLTSPIEYSAILQRHAEYDGETIEAFAHKVRDAKPKSIDAYLDEQRRLGLQSTYDLGVTAIAALILKRESSESDLMSRHDDDWYRIVLNAITHDGAESHTNKLWDAPVSFITFNYDRSLEAYLYRAAMARGVDRHAAVAGVRGLNIYHCYGQLGFVHPPDSHTARVPYGDVRYVRQAAAGIKIIGKNRREQLPRGAREAIANAQRIVITGFGFDPFNVELLELDKWIADPTKEVYITDMGLDLREANYLDELQGRRASMTRQIQHRNDGTRVFGDMKRFTGKTADLLRAGIVLE